jgi:hypothetical protein
LDLKANFKNAINKILLAKRMKAQRKTEEGQAENVVSSLAAYHARSQSEDHSEQQRPSILKVPLH